MRSARRGRVALALGLPCLVFALGTLARLSGHEVWDDGLMFSRYAENLARDGQIAWNPADRGGEPTWGITSLGHLAWVSVLRMVLAPAGADALAWAVVSSATAGWAFLLLILGAALTHGAASADGVGRLGLVAWTGLCLAAGFASVGAHLGTGMDTFTALAWLTLFLVLARRLERGGCEASGGRRGRWGLPIAVGLVAGLTFFVRPDATLFPAAVLAALLLFGRSPRARRGAFQASALASALAAFVLGASWLGARAVFGTWLPLPFYVKSRGQHYGDAFAAEYVGVAQAEFGLFVLAFWLPILAIVLDVVLSPRHWWREESAVGKGLAAAVAGFVVYHLTQVAPIMGGSQRFYQPLLPALLWLSWGSVMRLRRRFRDAAGDWRKAAVAGLALAGVLACGQATWTLTGEVTKLGQALDRQTWPMLDLETTYHQRASHYWPALDVVATLPPETLVAATEVGLPGAMNPQKAVLDLAGLHDPDFALEGFSAHRVFDSATETAPGGRPRRPDVIYLPHPHYETMLRELTSHPVLRSDYRVWSAEELGSVLGLAVRRGSVAEAPVAAALTRD